MKLHNTRTRQTEEFITNGKTVSLYCCGPTVYDYTHIGHVRKYIGDDFLKRTLLFLGYQVTHVMNITDVGHLSDDADTGEDKLEKGAQKYGKTVWEVAEYYTKYFEDTMRDVHVLPPSHTTKATDHIAQMISLIQTLQKKGFTYETEKAVYFDTSKDPTYGILSGQKLSDKAVGVRDEVQVDTQKKHPADFALWFKRVGRFADHTMHWDSPWGDGFPGWHIECSAMSMEYLGETIDIHTGGIDHIPVHHENELAQSECATGKEFVRYWVHHNHLFVEGTKMSKSLGNFVTIDDVKQRGIDAAALRILFMQTHYRKAMNFTWAAARVAQENYEKLLSYVEQFRKEEGRTVLSEDKDAKRQDFMERFKAAISADMNMAEAWALVWEVCKSNIPSEDKLDLLYSFDEVLGLNLRTAQLRQRDIPGEIQELAKRRWHAKQDKNFGLADAIRDEMIHKGYKMEEGKEGYTIKKL